MISSRILTLIVLSKNVLSSSNTECRVVLGLNLFSLQITHFWNRRVVGFGNKICSVTGHLPFLILFSNDSTLGALVFSFKLFLGQLCMIL